MNLDATKKPHVPPTDEEFRAMVVYRGYTHGQLHDAFKLVQSDKGWKYPIRKSVDQPTQEQMDLILASIDYIAGGGGRFVPVFNRPGKYVVMAPGYYHVIGA